MNRRTPFWLLSLFLLALVAIFARDARAAGNDAEVDALINDVLAVDYPKGDWKDANDKLALAQQACEGTACNAKTRAKLFIALGTVQAASGNTKTAKESFAIALAEDPTANLFSEYITPDIQKSFNEARGQGTSSGGTQAPQAEKQQKRALKNVYPGNMRAPRGWRSAEAYFYASQATQSEQARAWLDCADYADASLAAENRPTTRYLAATCKERAGLWIEAIADYQIVGDTAGKGGLHDTAAQAKRRAAALREKVPKVIIRPPADATDVQVLMNDTPVPASQLGGEIWVNPGQRTIVATGKVRGGSGEFRTKINVDEFESVTVDIKFDVTQSGDILTRCLLEAKSREEVQRCLEAGRHVPLTLHFATELTGYHNTDHVDVVSPGFFFSAESPTAGWGVNAGFLVDVVTAASADIVSMGSPRWQELRYVPSLGGHKKFGDYDVHLDGTISHEPDYLATSIGTGVSTELYNKQIVPSLSYEFSYDIAGRSGTPFSVFSHDIVRNSVDAGVTFILDKATFVAPSLVLVFENGDTSKPYRYVPMFDATTVAAVQPGQSIDSVNAARLPMRVLEQVPTSRQRTALSALFAHRFASSTIRAEERLYTDNWGLKATTTDARWLVDVTKNLILWPQLRFHLQSAVSFWQLAYTATITSNGVEVPALRTGDKELGPLMGLTLGGGARWAFGEKKNWAVSPQGSILYNKYYDHLFIQQRYAYFGATTLEVDFE